MGVKVWVYLHFHVLLWYGVYAGLLGTLLWVEGGFGICLQRVFRGMHRAQTRPCPNTCSNSNSNSLPPSLISLPPSRPPAGLR